MNQKPTLTKQNLVEGIFEKMGVTKIESSDWVELMFATLKSVLADGEKIKISGFGNFSVRDKKARKGRNPRTGVTLEISARRVVSFHPSQILRAEVNRDLNGGKP